MVDRRVKIHCDEIVINDAILRRVNLEMVDMKLIIRLSITVITIHNIFCLTTFQVYKNFNLNSREEKLFGPNLSAIYFIRNKTRLHINQTNKIARIGHTLKYICSESIFNNFSLLD